MPPLNDSLGTGPLPARWNRQDSYNSPSSFRRTVGGSLRIGVDDDQPFFYKSAVIATTRRRRVTTARFNDDAIVIHPTISLSEMTNDEKRQCWYDQQDYDEFRSDIAITVCLIQNRSDMLDDIKYTTRGAEIRVPTTLDKRHYWKRQARSSVLKEQQTQNIMGVYDSEKIAAIYCQCSLQAQFEAVEFASMDRIDANSFYNRQQYPKEEENEQEEIHDGFNDDWITSISSSSEDSSSVEIYSLLCCGAEEHSISFADDESGFDDSWIREVSVASL